MSFVYFRLPNTTLVVHNKLNDEPEELSTAAELNGRSGFVIAPFAPSTDMPILLVPTQWETIEPSQLHTLVSATGNTQMSTTLNSCDCTAERTQYNADFNRFHAELKAGRFAKIVLARCTRLTSYSTHKRTDAVRTSLPTLSAHVHSTLFNQAQRHMACRYARDSDWRTLRTDAHHGSGGHYATRNGRMERQEQA